MFEEIKIGKIWKLAILIAIDKCVGNPNDYRQIDKSNTLNSRLGRSVDSWGTV